MASPLGSRLDPTTPSAQCPMMPGSFRCYHMSSLPSAVCGRFRSSRLSHLLAKSSDQPLCSSQVLLHPLKGHCGSNSLRQHGDHRLPWIPCRDCARTPQHPRGHPLFPCNTRDEPIKVHPFKALQSHWCNN